MTSWTPAEVEKSALTLTVQEDGAYKWGSTHTNEEVAKVLRGIADDVEGAGS